MLWLQKILLLLLIIQSDQNMPSNFTEDKLIACLEAKQKYKGVNAYIQQACKFNEQMYTVINGALVHTLLGKQSNCMTRLLALRFFKELLLTGNFTMIDSLDQRIEDYVIEIAQYNSKGKESRGANYFMDIYHLKQDQQLERLGISYVVLATEIIGVVAKMYPVDENGEQTRFVKYYKKLTKLGVSLDFNKCNYFKKEDVQAFNKNYKKWLEWCEANYQEEGEKEQNLKDQSNKPNQSTSAHKPQQKQEMINLKNIALLNSKPSQKSTLPANALNLNQAQIINQSLIGPFPNLNFSATNQMNLVTNSLKTKQAWDEQKMVLQKEVNMYKKDVQVLQKQKREIEQRHGDEIKSISKKNEQNTVLVQTLRKKLTASEQTVLKLQGQRKDRQNQLQKQIKLKNELPPDGQAQKSKRDKNVIEAECYNILISPPINIDVLEEENDLLKQALEQCEKSNRHSQQLLKDQNQKLMNLLKQKQQQITLLKNYQHSSIEKQMIQHLIHEDSLIIADQIKIQKLVKQPQNMIDQRVDIKRQEQIKINLQAKHDRKDMSEKKPTTHQRPKSLKKTQSQRKLNKIGNYQANMPNTAMQFYNKNGNSHTAAKLQKTAQHFSRPTQQSVPKFITTFPYLDDYFPKLSEECSRFKYYCLLVSDPSIKTFYENESIKVSIKMVNFQKYIILINNQIKTQQKIKLMSAHESIILEGENIKKIASCTTGQFQIITSNVNLNLRFPMVNVIVGHSRLNLATSTPSNKIYQIPLPITLLNYCHFSKISEPFRRFQSKTLKYTTNYFLLNTNYTNIRECLAFIDFSYEERDLVYRGLVEFSCLSDAKLILQIKESNREVVITTEFEQFSNNSCNLAKVIIQVLMYLIKIQ